MRDDDDDNVLHDFDLSAWDAPPPPSGLADAVISRLDSTGVSAVAIVETRRSRSWLLVSGVAAIALTASVGTWAVVRAMDHTDAPTSGAMVADRARHLALPGVAAELDLGADVHWSRAGGTTRIDQRSGTATWRVDPNDELVIDVGAVGASIEATGAASLRVENHMNLSDARVIGASALTAAAVAMATVVVYEGYVKVSSAGETFIVQPGSTVEILPGQPPREPAQTLAVGGGPTTPVPATGSDDCVETSYDGAIPQCTPKTTTRMTPTTPTTPTTPAAGCDEVTCVLNSYDGACCQKFKPVAKPPTSTSSVSLDRNAIAAGIQAVKTAVTRCGADHPANGLVKVHVLVAPDGVPTVTVTAAPDADLGACVAAVVTTARFAATRDGGSFTYPFVFSGTPTCDAADLKDKGAQNEAIGQHAAALAQFEMSMRCKPDDQVVKLAFMAACNAGNLSAARKHYQEMASTDQERLLQVCLRTHITKGDLEVHMSPCDADDLRTKGTQDEALGQHALALDHFEAALRCKSDMQVIRLAFMASCNANNESKARHYYQRMTASDQARYIQFCLRDNISRDTLETPDLGFLVITSHPDAKILIDDADTGLTTPINGTKLKLAPGKHRVTFVLSDDRYSYPVTIKAGETETLSKDLR